MNGIVENDENDQFAGENDAEDQDRSQLLQQEPNDPVPSPQARCVQPGGLKFIVTGSVIFALGVTVALIVDIYTREHSFGGGAVSSDSILCNNIGQDVLEKGGSAVDAAIATTLCIGVVCLESSGIGGGGFMLVQSSEGKVEVIDFREVAPSSATKDMFKNKNNASQTGGLAVAVPGQVRGLELAHQKFGKLKWKELFKPSIDIASNGFKLHQTARKYLKDEAISKTLSPELKELLKNPELVKRPLLAHTLKDISSQGSTAFYDGHAAKSIVETVKKHNGFMSAEDLKNYTAKLRKPLTSDYHNYRIYTAGPPASGAVLLSALNILEGLNLTKVNRTDLEVYHYLVEALKFSYAQRSHLADPDFEEMTNVTETMLSKQNAKVLRGMINKSKTYNNASHYGPFFETPSNKGTSQVTVIDKSGNLVSVTSTINGPFGSKLYTPSGILLNNQMDDFSTPGTANFFGIAPSEANYIKPGKRPLSSVTPVIALSKSDLCGHQIVLGAAGGSRITSAVIQVLLNMLSFDQNLTSAIEWPRLHHQLVPMILDAEGDRFSKMLDMKDVPKFLEKKGNEVNTSPKFKSVVNGATKQDGQLSSWADSRRNGADIAIF